MDKIKLNFYRFDEKITMADLRVSVGIDDTGLTTGAKKVETASNNITKSIIKIVEANDSLAASSASTGNKLVDLANNALVRYKNAFSQMKTLMGSSVASPKFKIQAQTNIDKAQLGDFDSMSASTMTAKELNKLITFTNSILKQNTSEYSKQVKEIEKQIAAEDKVIAEENARKTVLSQLSSSLAQVGQQKAGQGGSDPSLAQWQQFMEMKGLKQASDAETASLRQLDQQLKTVVITHTKMINGVKELVYDYKSVPGAINNTTNAFSRVKATLNDYANIMDKATIKTDKLKTSFGKLKQAAITWRIMYGAFSQIWNMLANTVDKAAAYEEALNLYTVALGEYAEQGSEWANKISSSLFLDPQTVMQYTGALYNLVQGLGVGSKAAYVMGTNLTQLAYDMSSYLNIDVQSAYDKLQSAITGQSRAVASAGIAMQMASLQELAYQLGIKKTVNEMTQAEKTYLRYIQIMRSTVNMQGDLARTIVTPENALRVVRQQFNLLARAIGQVFIPIILRAIPYVMALTQILRELAASLGAKLGYKIQEIDYSSLKTVDTAVEKINDNISSGVGKTTKGINNGIKGVKNNVKSLKDSVNSTLASFDDLNVVMSKNKNDGTGGTGGTGGGGIGGIGGIGGGGSILPDLEKFVDGYDMLDGLTDQFAKNVDKARKNLAIFGKVLKTIVGLFALWKLAKFAGNLINFANNIRKAWTAGTGFAGVLKTMVTRFADGFRYSKYWGEQGLKPLISGFRNILPPALKFVGAIGTTVGAFAAGIKSMKEWDGTTKGMVGNIVEATVKIGLLTGAAALFIGSGAAVVTAIAGITGGLIGLSIAMNNYMSEEEKQKAYDHLFDHQGVSLKILTNDFVDGNNKIIEYTREMSKLKHEMEESDTNVNKAKTAFEDLHLAILGGNKSKTVIDNLTASTKEYVKSIDENAETRINYTKTYLDNLLKEEKISKGVYDRELQSAQNYYKWLTGEQHEYIVRLAKLDKQLADGTITQEEYDAKLAALNVEFKNTKPEIEGTVDAFSNLNRTAAQKIDVGNIGIVVDSVTRLKDSYNDTKDALDEQTRNAKANYELQTKEARQHLGDIVKSNNTTIDDILAGRKKLSDADQEAFDKYYNHIQQQDEMYTNTMNSISGQSETLSATYKDYLATILAQISEAGLEGETEFKGTVDTIKGELTNLGNVDPSKSVDQLFGKFTTSMLANGETFKNTGVKEFQKYGFAFSEAELWGFTSEEEKSAAKKQAAINKTMDTINPSVTQYWTEGMKKVAKGASGGFINQFTSPADIKNWENSINQKIVEVGKGTEKTCKVSLGENAAKNATSGFTDTFGKDGKLKITGKVNEVILNTSKDSKSNSDKSGKAIQSDIIGGMCTFSAQNKAKVTKFGGDVATTSINSTKDKLKSHSPSKVYQAIGGDVVQGFVNGISQNKNKLTNEMTKLIEAMQNKLKGAKLSLSFSTDMSSSFNKVLSKLETFISRWRKAINNALSETKKSLDSVSTNKSGKISYTPFQPISVPRFAEGGYPTRGDLFFANENGMPEYITSLGGRTAVVNQEQMVQALTNAIVQGLSNLPTGNNQDVVVYLGNDLIYKGMAKYRERENNRYGTTIA